MNYGGRQSRHSSLAQRPGIAFDESLLGWVGGAGLRQPVGKAAEVEESLRQDIGLETSLQQAGL